MLVRNEQDTYMEKEASLRLAEEKNWQYQQVPGQHDDLWENPQVYIEIVNQELKSIYE